MASGISYLFMLLLLFSGGTRGTDLLDTLPTDSYWQVKNVAPSLEQLLRDASADKAPDSIDKYLKDLQSDDFKTRDAAKKQLDAMGPAIIPQLRPAVQSKDPEVAATASELIARFNGRGQQREIRRLMAIRTLGERKEKDALPLLKTLTDSQELFVSEYALRAIAQIQDATQPPVDRKKDFLADAALLSDKLSIAGQLSGIAGRQLTLSSLVDMIVDARDPAAQGLPPGVAPPPPPDKKKLLAKATAQILKLIEQIGNVRFDGITVGVSDNVGPDGGFVTVILRGKYNAPIVFSALKALAPPGNTGVKIWNDGAFNVLETDPNSAFVFVSNERLVVVVADNAKDKTAAVDAMIAALKTGKGAFPDNKDLAALQKTVDTTLPLWAVAKLNAAMKTLPPMAAFDTITLEGKPTADGIAFSFHGVGTDPEKVTAAVDDLNKELKSSITDIQTQLQNHKELQPVADLMTSIKIVADGAKATLTGEIKQAIVKTFMSEVGSLVNELLNAPDAVDLPGGMQPPPDAVP